MTSLPPSLSKQQWDAIATIIACDQADTSNLERRSGAFTQPCLQKCKHYAKFLSGSTRREADTIFWGLFVFVFILLGFSSVTYARAIKKVELPEAEVEGLEDGARFRAYQRRIRLRCLWIGMGCSVLSVISVATEAFAGMSIAFCDGEDLMFFYWGFWSLTQIGSVIAMFGVAVNEYGLLVDIERPPWGVALGTPVLVIAAIQHLVHEITKSLFYQAKEEVKVRRASRVEARSIAASLEISRTLEAEPESSDASLRNASTGTENNEKREP